MGIQSNSGMITIFYNNGNVWVMMNGRVYFRNCNFEKSAIFEEHGKTDLGGTLYIYTFFNISFYTHEGTFSNIRERSNRKIRVYQ